MKTYHHMLLVTPLTPDSRNLVVKAEQMAENFGARLSILHVFETKENRNNQSYSHQEKTLIFQAQQQLSRLGKKLFIPQSDICFAIGSASKIIPQIAKNLCADMVVIGNSLRSNKLQFDLTILLIIKGLHCDVMTVSM